MKKPASVFSDATVATMRMIAGAFFAMVFLGLMDVADATAGQLSVTIDGIRNSKGYLLVSVYDSKASFLNLSLACMMMKFRAPAAQVHFALPDLPAGRYAIVVVHDENNNDKLDMNALGIPIEGVGLSNGPHGSLALPSFDADAVEFSGQDKSIDIGVHY